jgi:putative serine protease PepD
MTEQQGWPTQYLPPQPAPQPVPPSGEYPQAPLGTVTTPAPPTAPTHHKPRRIGATIAAAVATMAIAGGSAVAGGFAALELHPAAAQTVATSTTSSSGTAAQTTSLANVAAEVLPSVVSIQTESAIGSGVILSSDGSILTNNHVVATAQGSTVQVTFSNGKTATATIIGTDPSHDLAVIKASGVSGLTPITFADSSSVKVGDTVLAVGSPLGLEGSVTSGIVSALNRTIDVGENAQNTTSLTGAIQTDAAINPGNSGGALVNSAGQLIGINTAIASASSDGESGSIGVGFAIASNTVKQIAAQLLNS